MLWMKQETSGMHAHNAKFKFMDRTGKGLVSCLFWDKIIATLVL